MNADRAILEAELAGARAKTAELERQLAAFGVKAHRARRHTRPKPPAGVSEESVVAAAAEMRRRA